MIKPVITSLFETIHVFLNFKDVVGAVSFGRSAGEDKFIILNNATRWYVHK